MWIMDLVKLVVVFLFIIISARCLIAWTFLLAEDILLVAAAITDKAAEIQEEVLVDENGQEILFELDEEEEAEEEE